MRKDTSGQLCSRLVLLSSAQVKGSCLQELQVYSHHPRQDKAARGEQLLMLGLEVSTGIPRNSVTMATGGPGF
jgi:hypothetical protein